MLKANDNHIGIFMGKENGMNMYLVPVRENNEKKKEINLDDGLFDDDEDLCAYYEDCEFDIEPPKEKDSYNLTLKDFREMDFREIYFHLYQLMKSISSALFDVKEVRNDATEV